VANSKLSRFNLAMIVLSIIMFFTATVTVTYAAIVTQITTSTERVNIDGVGAVTCTVTLTNGNIYKADSSGNKQTTQTRLYPGGYFAVPLTLSYAGDGRPSGHQIMALKTGTGSFTFSSMVVKCSDSTSNAITSSATIFNNYFPTAQIKCPAANINITAGTNNTSYYIFLQTKSPVSSDPVNPARFMVNSITTLQISFSVTAYTVD